MATPSTQKTPIPHNKQNHDLSRPGNFRLEPLVYRLESESEDDYRTAFADLVVAGAEDLTESGADLLKLQYPGDAAGCERLTAAAGEAIPWALLGGSEVGGGEFAAQLEMACRAGACGFLAGRAIWSGALGLAGEQQRTWLAEEARPLFERLTTIARTYGRSI